MKTVSGAFTRIEMLAVLSAIALVGALAFPLVATTRSDSERAACMSNLKRIGHALRVWGADRQDRAPWMTSVADGGTVPTTGAKSGNAWFEYLALSNELASARVLACPSDANVKVASEWLVGPSALANSAFRGNAVSYLLGGHAFAAYPESLISADRNMQVHGTGFGCSYTRLNTMSAVQQFGLPPVGWTNGLHESAGHLLFTDGRVNYVPSSSLQSLLVGARAEDNGVVHLLRAR